MDYNLVLLRHGQSQWNLENRFTGITDIPLTDCGIREAESARDKLIDFKYDIIYTSILQRAFETSKIINHLNVETIQTVNLNERDYGSLTGLNKLETIEKYGEEQVHQWRRSYEISPPDGESLKDVVKRVKSYWEEKILFDFASGKRVIIVAHNNSLRALIMVIKELNSSEIMDIVLNTGEPFFMEI